MVLFQILFTLFALFAVVSVLGRKKDGNLSTRGAGFWVLFWLSALAVVWFPNSTTVLANTLGIGRGSDFIIYVSVAVIFFLLFKLHIKIEEINRNITKVVRKEALDKNNFEK